MIAAYEIHQPGGFDGDAVSRYLNARGFVTLMRDEHDVGGRTVWTAPGRHVTPKP